MDGLGIALVAYIILFIALYWLVVVKYPIRFGMPKSSSTSFIGFINFVLFFFITPIGWVIGKLIELLIITSKNN